MLRGFLLSIGALRAIFLSHADLVLENLALRQQLACSDADKGSFRRRRAPISKLGGPRRIMIYPIAAMIGIADQHLGSAAAIEFWPPTTAEVAMSCCLASLG